MRAPCLERLALVREGLVRDGGLEREIGVAAGAVRELDASGPERQDQAGIVDRRGAVDARSLIPEAGRWKIVGRRARRQAVEPDSSALERELGRHRWGFLQGSGRVSMPSMGSSPRAGGGLRGGTVRSRRAGGSGPTTSRKQMPLAGSSKGERERELPQIRGKFACFVGRCIR